MIVETLMYTRLESENSRYRCDVCRCKGDERINECKGSVCIDVEEKFFSGKDFEDEIILPVPSVSRARASLRLPVRDCRLVHGARRDTLQIGSRRRRRSQNLCARFELG